jgi:hypothetical protein
VDDNIHSEQKRDEGTNETKLRISSWKLKRLNRNAVRGNSRRGAIRYFSTGAALSASIRTPY